MSVTNDLPLDKFNLDMHGTRIMQLGIGMSLFINGPFMDARDGVFEMWQKYVSFVGKDTFTWARLGGGNRSRKVGPVVFKTIESWLTGKKDYGDSCWISIHEGPMDDLGQYSFLVTGRDRSTHYENEASYVEIVLPVTVLDSPGAAELAKVLIEIAAPVPYQCGVGGFVFHRSPYKFNATINRMGQLASRYDGVEISANERLVYMARQGLTTVNWITFVGENLLDQLGGASTLEEKLPKDSVAIPCGQGTAIQTGSEPKLGDKNKKEDELAALREVYRALKPVIFVNPKIALSSFSFDSERTVQWLQRLGE